MEKTRWSDVRSYWTKFNQKFYWEGQNDDRKRNQSDILKKLSQW